MFGFLKAFAATEKTVPAVFDEDLTGLLTAIGKLEEIENGKSVCAVCHSAITLQNLQLIVPQDGGVFLLVCNDPKCVEAFSSGDGSK